MRQRVWRKHPHAMQKTYHEKDGQMALDGKKQLPELWLTEQSIASGFNSKG
jgi:hypothetical protein